MGHNYFGKSVEHALRRFLNDSEPISLSQILTPVKNYLDHSTCNRIP